MKTWEYKSHTVPPEHGIDKLYEFNREFEAVLNEEGAAWARMQLWMIREYMRKRREAIIEQDRFR